MLSRTANALYWMSRYLERAECTARLIEVNLHLSLDLPADEAEAWDAVVATTGDQEAFEAAYGAPTRAGALQFLAFDLENGNSVQSAIRYARENARTVREHLPAEAWEAINALYLQLRALSATPAEGLPGAIASVRVTGRRIEGLLDAAFLRDEGWHFAQLGRQIERADQASRLVDVQHVLLEGPGEGAGLALRWEAVLRSANALTNYRRRHGVTDGRLVAAFLLLEGAFPGSVAFCLGAAEEHLRAITSTPTGQFRNHAEKVLGRLAAELRYTELDDVLNIGLHAWLDGFQARLGEAASEIHRLYFDAPAHEATTASMVEADNPQQQQQQ
jgi:uncharacterized alpha-E superfamily protein